MEKARISERTAAGRATAQALLAAGKLTQHGKGSMGRPKEADPVAVRQWKQANSASISATAKHFELSVSTIKRYCAGV
jgi:putative DNA-invertase from lambdoid prophage Rac